ncbi:P protein [Maize yellow striate virus]|uniref:P protein n=1 Tax=Maize yellow striate virus TaxID=1168550 RepID=A0A2D1GTP8_9RHAB|nr:P protein [Maize yellow striate virus]ATN96435.1 P protein [Maize yellow striate virus]ATN96445.1 phosphoprotein [Maize yellow striate virus]
MASSSDVQFLSGIPDDIHPRSYDLSADGIFSNAEEEEVMEERQAEQDLPDIEEEEPLVEKPAKGEKFVSGTDELVSILKDYSNRKGMGMKKEWVNIMKRRFHEMGGKMLKTHVDFFLLGIQAERNMSVDRDFKDTATRLSDEVNRVSGVGKRMLDAQQKMEREMEQKMKEITAHCKKMEMMVAKVETAVENASRPSSISSWAMGGPSREEEEERDYDKFLSMIGFEDKHIKSATMKKCYPAISDEMYVHVITGEADHADMTNYYRLIMEYAESKVLKKKSVAASRNDPYPGL